MGRGSWGDKQDTLALNLCFPRAGPLVRGASCVGGRGTGEARPLLGFSFTGQTRERERTDKGRLRPSLGWDESVRVAWPYSPVGGAREKLPNGDNMQAGRGTGAQQDIPLP